MSQVSPWLPLLSASPAPGVCGICCFRLNVQQKSHPSEGVYLGWTPWLSTPASVPVCLLPLCVCPDSHGQSLHYCVREYSPSTPSPYVLFSLQFCLLGDLVHNCLHPKDTGQSCVTKPVHFLQQVASFRCTLSSRLVEQNISSLQSWHMIATWLCVTP